MSVVAQDKSSGQLTLFCKGAPEVIELLCKKETVPPDFAKVVRMSLILHIHCRSTFAQMLNNVVFWGTVTRSL